MLYVHARRQWNKIQRAYRKLAGPARLRNAKSPVRIVIGASGWCDPGWIPTEQSFLDLLNPGDWERFFKPDSVDAMLAEHVWEHLEPDQAHLAAKMCYAYLKPGGYLRLAVPDGFHPNPEYIEWSRPGGRSPGQLSNDHRVLYNYITFRDLFQSAGFHTHLYEYFTEDGRFCQEHWSPADGMIRRSRAHDKRNRDGGFTYTSIIMDAVKGEGSFAWVS